MPLAQGLKAAELCLHRLGKGQELFGVAFCRLFVSLAARVCGLLCERKAQQQEQTKAYGQRMKRG
tara:strand:- start:18885 stop:19079 length:195 start_codon:yes stop_codon:yes gene_type:complete